MYCRNHNPIQHRDAKPPWCHACGLTAEFNQPKSKLFPGKERPMTYKYYELKPDNQKAVQVTPDNMQAIANWCGGEVMESQGIEENVTGGVLYIPTLQGPITASEGDYVAQDVKGRFNVFSKERFEARYQETSSTRNLPGDRFFGQGRM